MCLNCHQVSLSVTESGLRPPSTHAPESHAGDWVEDLLHGLAVQNGEEDRCFILVANGRTPRDDLPVSNRPARRVQGRDWDDWVQTGGGNGDLAASGVHPGIELSRSLDPVVHFDIISAAAT